MKICGVYIGELIGLIIRVLLVMSKDVQGEIDKIPYDAPLAFKLPSYWWCSEKGGVFNNRTDALTDRDVPPVDLSGKWILLSGANSGIGREAAITFARWGANLVLACRQPAVHEEHPQVVTEECIKESVLQGHAADIEWWEYDATDLQSVSELCERYVRTGRQLDILCNNAGIGSSPGGHQIFKTKNGHEIVHQVNLLSHVLMTLSLLPALAKSREARVVCTTSSFHYFGIYDMRNFDSMAGVASPGGVQLYKNNKLYFQIWLCELQYRLIQHKQYKHITINGFHPGYVSSNIWILNFNPWLRLLQQWLLIRASKLFGITSKQGSMALVFLATAPECGADPALQGVGHGDGKGGGRYFNRIWEEESMPHCRDRDARLRVWRKVDQELQLKASGLLDVLGIYSGQEQLT